MDKKTKFRPRKARAVSERAASTFEAKYSEEAGDERIAANDGNGHIELNAIKTYKRERATFYLPSDLLEQLRNAVVALRGAPQRFTMAGVVESALRAELARLADEHNGGEAFPMRAMEPYTGRPPK